MNYKRFSKELELLHDRIAKKICIEMGNGIFKFEDGLVTTRYEAVKYITIRDRKIRVFGLVKHDDSQLELDVNMFNVYELLAILDYAEYKRYSEIDITLTLTDKP